MAWLLLFVPPLREAPVNRYDVLDRNVVEHEDGSEFCQWIVWDWDHEAGVHRCQGWCFRQCRSGQRDVGSHPVSGFQHVCRLLSRQ